MCVVNQEKDSPPQHNKSHLESPLKKKKNMVWVPQDVQHLPHLNNYEQIHVS